MWSYARTIFDWPAPTESLGEAGGCERGSRKSFDAEGISQPRDTCDRLARPCAAASGGEPRDRANSRSCPGDLVPRRGAERGTSQDRRLRPRSHRRPVFIDSAQAAQGYADLRAGKPGGGNTLAATFDRRLPGKVLDLPADPRWARFLASKPPVASMGETWAHYMARSTELYNNGFHEFLRQNKLQLSQYDAIIAEDQIQRPGSSSSSTRRLRSASTTCSRAWTSRACRSSRRRPGLRQRRRAVSVLEEADRRQAARIEAEKLREEMKRWSRPPTVGALTH